MNLVWIAGLSLFVAFEKFAPFGGATTKAAAIVLIAAEVLLSWSDFVARG
jgi:predicted metal-binding membrane protein